MSIAEPCEIVTDAPNDARFAEKVPRGRPRRSPNKSRVQLAYTTIWALEDMLDAAEKGRRQMEAMRRWVESERLDAKGRYDTARLARLGELDGMIADLALHVGRLERLASDARVGIYRGKQPDKTKI